MVKININIEKRHLVILIGILLVIGIGFVVASNWANSNGVGHSLDEIQPQNCSSGQVAVGWNASGIICIPSGYKYPDCEHCNWTGWRCVDQEDDPYDWYGDCENKCLVEVQTGSFCG
jgi:hypothetical protein